MSAFKKFSYAADGALYEVFVGADGGASFRRDGLIHRENGPAALYVYSTPTYYLSNVRISKAEHARRTNK